MQVTYPKKTDKPLYHGLVKQLESLNIPFLRPEEVTEGTPLRQRFDVIIDAIFGFSFYGSPRPPFDSIVQVCGACSSPLHSNVAYEMRQYLVLTISPGHIMGRSKQL